MRRRTPEPGARRPRDQAVCSAAAALAALGLWGGTPLPGDPYSSWAAEPRRRLVVTRVRLLDLLADAAEAAGRA